MAHYHKTYISHVDVSGCQLAFSQAIKATGWSMVRSSDARRLICREPNDRGEWEENLVTLEIILDLAPNKMTRIDLNAGSGRSGEAAYEYAKHHAEGLLRRVETAVRPQKTYAS
jgi:hypothetical protein